MPVLLTPSRSVCLSRAVFFRDDGDLPDEAELLERTRAWIEERMSGADRDRALRALATATPTLERVRAASVPRPPHDELPVPPGVEEAALLDRATHAVVVDVADTLGGERPGLRILDVVTRAVAHALDGVVYEPDRLFVRPLDVRSEAPRHEVSIEHHTGLVLCRDTDGLLLCLSGLNRFGLPPIEISGVPLVLAPAALHVLFRTAEALHELLCIAEPGRQLVLEHVEVPDDAGEPLPVGLTLDPTDEILFLHPHDGRDSAAWLQEVQERLDLVEEEEHVLWMDPEEGGLREAIEAARAELPEVRRRFRAGLETGAALLLRVTFAHGADEESMWVEVDRWTRHGLRGRLANAPVVCEDLQRGSRVRFTEDRVMDWQIRHADGRSEGARTQAVLVEQLGRQAQA